MQHILVIGYGNELRTDDGLGPRIAFAIEHEQLPGVQVRIVHQLTPELAEPISAAEAVVFIDAAVGPPFEVQVQPLESLSSPLEKCVLQPWSTYVDPELRLPMACRASTRGKLPQSLTPQFRPHSSSPQVLLGMAAQLFGRCPPGWWMTVPAADFGFGQSLSAEAEAAVPTAFVVFKQLLEAISRKHPFLQFAKPGHRSTA